MDFFHKLLNFYNLDEKGYAEFSAPFSFSDIPDISNYECVKKAISRLEEAKERNEKILIYGDYDCDGVMAASISKMALNEFGLQAEAYLPSRYIDGYGLTVANVEKIIKSYDLILTVDNGVTANEAIEVAYQNNVEVIVLDHHSYEKEPEHIVSLIHPLTVGLSNPSISAGFLSYLFSVALLKKQDAYREILGATSLLSDAMEITSYNRKAVGLAIELWKENGNIAFERLIKGEKIDENVISMQVVPAINSIGRMNTGNKINRLIKYFTNPNGDGASIIANWMLDKNKERKDLVQATASSIIYELDKPSVMVKSNLPEGINGLLANKILDKTNKTVAVYAPSEKGEGLLVGSMRSKDGCPLTDFIKEVQPMLVAGGGHAFAAGFTIKEEDLPAFEKALNAYCADKPFNNENKETIELSLDDITMDNYKILRSFGPFGQGHHSPLFSLKIEADRLLFSPDGTRLQTYIGPNARIFSFNIKRDDVPQFGEITLNFELNLNVFRGRETVSADVSDIIC